MAAKVPVKLRLDERVARKLRKSAERDDRTVSAQAERLIERGLRQGSTA